MTIRINIDLANAGRIERKMAQIWRQEMGKAMRKAASMCKPVLIARTVDAPPAAPPPSAYGQPGAIDTRKIIDNWEFLFTPGDCEVMIFNRAEHAGYAEDGVKSSMGKIGGSVAVGLFESWLIRKGIQITERRGSQTVVMPNARAARFLIFKINQRSGEWRFQPRKFVGRAAARIQEIFNREIVAQRDRMIAKAIASVATRGRV